MPSGVQGMPSGVQGMPSGVQGMPFGVRGGVGGAVWWQGEQTATRRLCPASGR